MLETSLYLYRKKFSLSLSISKCCIVVFIFSVVGVQAAPYTSLPTRHSASKHKLGESIEILSFFRERKECLTNELVQAGRCFCYFFHHGKLDSRFKNQSRLDCFVELPAYFNYAVHCQEFLRGSVVDMSLLYAKVGNAADCILGKWVHHKKAKSVSLTAGKWVSQAGTCTRRTHKRCTRICLNANIPHIFDKHRGCVHSKKSCRGLRFISCFAYGTLIFRQSWGLYPVRLSRFTSLPDSDASSMYCTELHLSS